MTPYVISTGAIYTEENTVVVPRTLTVVNGQVRRRRSLTCSSLHGNFTDPTAFSFSKEESGHCTGWSKMSYPKGFVLRTGYGLGVDQCFISTSQLASALDPYNKALSKLYDKLRNDVDLSIDIYQRAQTIRTLQNAAKLLRNPIDAFLKLNRDFAKDHKIMRGTKLAGSKWLEWQYGVRPTLSTIHDIGRSVVDALSSTNGMQLVKARASTKDFVSRTITPPTSQNTFHPLIPTKFVCSDSKRVEIALWYKIDNRMINGLSQFTSLNPISFFYENIPYSFVLDWAIDVGGYLRNMETALMTGLQFQKGYVTRTRLQNTKVSVRGGASQYGTYYSADYSGSSSRKELSRSIISSMPRPQVPQVNIKLGTERLLSAASLLSNFLNIPPSKRR